MLYSCPISLSLPSRLTNLSIAPNPSRSRRQPPVLLSTLNRLPSKHTSRSKLPFGSKTSLETNHHSHSSRLSMSSHASVAHFSGMASVSRRYMARPISHVPLSSVAARVPRLELCTPLSVAVHSPCQSLCIPLICLHVRVRLSACNLGLRSGCWACTEDDRM
jgi:hypothetical protein